MHVEVVDPDKRRLTVEDGCRDPCMTDMKMMEERLSVIESAMNKKSGKENQHKGSPRKSKSPDRRDSEQTAEPHSERGSILKAQFAGREREAAEKERRLQAVIEEQRRQIEEQRQQIERLSRLEQTVQTVQDGVDRHKEAELENEALRSQIMKLEGQLERQAHDLEQLQASKADVERERNTSQEKASQLQVRHDSVKRMLDARHMDEKRHDQEIHDLNLAAEAKIQEVAQENKELKQRLSEAQRQHKVLQEEIRSMSKENDELKREHANYEQEWKAHVKERQEHERQRLEQLDQPRISILEKENVEVKNQLRELKKDFIEKEMTQQQLKKELDLKESELRQERNVSSLPTPGEYLRMVKAKEGESYACRNSSLKMKANMLEADLQSSTREIEILKRHMTPSAKAAAQLELSETQNNEVQDP